MDAVLALRGDPPKTGNWDWKQGYFQHAADLVAFTREHEPDMGIGVAAYPAPHPESRSLALDRRYTEEKLRAGAGFAVSQLFFDVREHEALVEDLARQRKGGWKVPVVPGILPIQSFDSLRRVLSLCGANIPGKLLILSLGGGSTAGRASRPARRGPGFRRAPDLPVADKAARRHPPYTPEQGDLFASDQPPRKWACSVC